MLTTKMIRLILLTLSLIVFTACDNNDSDTTTPVVETTEIADEAGNIAPVVKVYPPKTTVQTGETVRFVQTNSFDPDGEIVKYQWLENGRTIARVPYMWKVYNVPGTYKIKLILTDNDGATSSAEYTITVEAAPVVATAPVYDTYFENNTSTPLPDRVTATIDIDANNAVPSITKVTATIDIVHTFDGDLVISLISPTGTTILLTNGNGGGGNNFEFTTFDDDAAIAISAGTAPFVGSYMPDEPLSSFIGENATGTWTLHIFDQYGGDSGTLNSWSMTVE